MAIRTKKTVATILVVVAVVIGLVFVFTYPRIAAITTTPETSTGVIHGKKPAHRIDWTFTTLPEDITSGMPATKVSLRVDEGDPREVGVYNGNCFTIIGSAWEFVQNEASGAICYFAGGGTEIGVFNLEDGSLSVQKGDVDEGSAEVPGTRGNFTELFKISL